MRKNFTAADSPVNVAALVPAASQSQPVEQMFLGVLSGTVVFNLPSIADLPGGAFNQKIAIVTLASGAQANIVPDADDTICTLGTGISSTISGLGDSVVLQPVGNNVWHSDENSATAL